MCGICGILNLDGSLVKKETLDKMCEVLKHRGPDNKGIYIKNNLGLGHQRLSIIDLSEKANQPFTNETQTHWIVYNGEVYNYLEIRKELEKSGHRFKSQTDTEVILHAYDEWGMDCLKHFNGMWAFCIWDSRKRRIFCARDRAGVKPFYYTFNGQRFGFASEIKALLALDDITPKPNDQIVADYLFAGLLDHTHETFFENIYQLRPGEYLLIEDQRPVFRSYWDIEPKEVHFSRDEDYAQRFRELLEDSIRLRLRSDVPIGTCLSGGLDSSSIVCLANKLMFDGQSIDPKLVGERQKTFSSCFENHAYDERKFIELVIGRTGAEKNYTLKVNDVGTSW